MTELTQDNLPDFAGTDTMSELLDELNAPVSSENPMFKIGMDHVLAHTGQWLLTESSGMYRSDAALRLERELYQDADDSAFREMYHFAVRNGFNVEQENTHNYAAQITNDMQFVTFKLQHGTFAIISIHCHGDVRANYADPFVVELAPEHRIAPERIKFWCSDCGYENSYDPYTGWMKDPLSEENYHEGSHIECPECESDLSPSVR